MCGWLFYIVCLLLCITLLCCLQCVKVWLNYNWWLLSYWILSKNRRDFHKICNILATISHYATTFLHMINKFKAFHMVANKQYQTIILISYFQFVNILARKNKGETFILNRPLRVALCSAINLVSFLIYMRNHNLKWYHNSINNGNPHLENSE